jgi:hypothetical protein
VVVQAGLAARYPVMPGIAFDDLLDPAPIELPRAHSHGIDQHSGVQHVRDHALLTRDPRVQVPRDRVEDLAQERGRDRRFAQQLRGGLRAAQQ